MKIHIGKYQIIVYIILIIISGGLLYYSLDYVISNWPAIILPILVTIFFSIYSFINRSSAEIERISRAKQEILSILENLIINKRETNYEKINHLKNSIIREHSINENDLDSPLSLLEDLNLRFEKSNHLSREQKIEYSNKITEILKEIEQNDAISKSIQKIELNTINDEIKKSVDSNKFKNNHEKFINFIDENELNILPNYNKVEKKKSISKKSDYINILSALAIFITTFAIVIISMQTFGINFMLNSLNNIMTILIAIMGLITVIYSFYSNQKHL